MIRRGLCGGRRGGSGGWACGLPVMGRGCENGGEGY